jgi:hypothetical protein
VSEELLIGLAGGAIGAVLTAIFTEGGRAWIAWGEVALHDEEAKESNAQLVVWVDDRTRELLAEAGAHHVRPGQREAPEPRDRCSP